MEKDNIEEQKEDVRKQFGGFASSTKIFLKELLNIRDNTDAETTVQHIKDDISFKGHTVWILVCSIFIASIGLNANSTAVVIGAMLISPLIGPILGAGMSLAINDMDTLRRSLKNFIVMIGISIFTAFLFFKIFPIQDESSELLARTAPDIRDVLIAFIGGLSLVIARAKKGTMASVIYGVSIATALMPPLCTVGFGLAIWNFDYVGGAMYLFLINATFIALATVLVLKILRIPMIEYASKIKQKRGTRIAGLVVILVMIPATITFFKAWQESNFKNQSKEFISKHIQSFKFSSNGRFLKNMSDIKFINNDEKYMELVFMGDEEIPESVINTWKSHLQDYSQLENCKLDIIQNGKDKSQDRLKYVNELYESKKSEIKYKDERITLLEREVEKLSEFKVKQVPFDIISKEIHINYQQVKKLSFAYEIRTDFEKADTIPTFYIKLQEGTPISLLNQIEEWMVIRIDNIKVEVKLYREQ